MTFSLADGCRLSIHCDHFLSQLLMDTSGPFSIYQSDSVGCTFDNYVHSRVKCGLLNSGKSLALEYTYFPVQVSLNVDFKKERLSWRWDSNQRLSDSHHLSKIYLWGSSKRPLIIKIAKIRSSRPNLSAQADVKKSHNELLWN